MIARIQRAWRSAALASALALAAATNASSARWHDALPAPPAPIPALTVPWHDALDAALGARVASDGGLSADLSLRWRLDAPAYLERARADAADLAAHTEALERQAWLRQQLEVVASSCEAAWRSLQRGLIDDLIGIAPGTGLAPEAVDELSLLRALIALGAQDALEVEPLTSCRLDAVVADLELAPEHPRLLEAAAAARLAERSALRLDSPAPASLWLHADLSHDPFGARAGARIGLDLPLDVTLGAAELTLASDGRVADATVRWVSGGGASPRHPSRLGAPNQAEGASALRPVLETTLTRQRLETALHRLEAERRWTQACASSALEAIAACLARPPADLGWVDALLAAIDSELTVLHGALAAIETSGWSLAQLLPAPR